MEYGSGYLILMFCDIFDVRKSNLLYSCIIGRVLLYVSACDPIEAKSRISRRGSLRS